ncbi:Na/Pi cotransporter family protein [Faecalicatena contorta]|uniref:Na/Pi cotransporter family protein n=1 Tax=Lachnospiraceae TaxID=186803 RepID=UPI001F288801|nr:Na/Pi cotransporter family protein [Faecalicatena contorta]MCF2667080.1 Na/Pi cotransporter family protein [Faecalicatena contorta]MCI6535949.1 Na/Pi cotransporter family protein [Lachnospiraceae bacterium]MDY2612408.1 Na/Pi cotransporter family protein [Lachnospiraceae bacterium]
MSITTIFMLFGGLGFFLYGMKMMSEGLEKAAGAKMRSILEFFTKNRFIGMVVGIIFTAIIQSSNATTVMVVSFVNSGLMNLMQASGVILGANIGTTITGQLIAFNLSDIAPLIVIIGVIMIMFCKKQSIKKIGEVILGFGILFMGLSIMSDSMSAVKNSPRILNFLASLTNPFAAILVGFLITAVLQSSSATVGIILLMVSQKLLEFTICPFMILGCNIGSCVSALVASLSGKKDAKRAALIHFLFNVIGSAIFFCILLVAVEPFTNAILYISGGSLARSVANVHTLMKVLEVAMMFPFMGWIVKLTYKIVPGKDTTAEDQYELLYIGDGSMMSPTTAVMDSIHEIEHMGKVAVMNLKKSMDALCNLNEKEIQEVYETEEYIDFLNRKITDYLVKANEIALPIADEKLIGGLFHVVNDIERIGDHAENFVDSAKTRIERGIELTDKAKKQLLDMMDKTTKILEYSLEMFTNRNYEHMREILQLEEEIDEMEKKLQNAHVKRLTKNKCTPEAGMIFSDTISGLERVADHATNIAFAILEPMNEQDDEEEE